MLAPSTPVQDATAAFAAHRVLVHGHQFLGGVVIIVRCASGVFVVLISGGDKRPQGQREHVQIPGVETRKSNSQLAPCMPSK